MASQTYDTPSFIIVKIRFMKIVTFCIYITICFLIIGCKKVLQLLETTPMILWKNMKQN